MITISETRVLPFTSPQLFALVADVERYPDFVPLWYDAHVTRRTKDGYHTDQEIGIGLWRERFRTKTVLQPQERIDVISKDSALGDFTIRWTFEATTDGGCRIGFFQEHECNGVVFPWFWKTALRSMARDTVRAFERHAEDLYGSASRGDARVIADMLS